MDEYRWSLGTLIGLPVLGLLLLLLIAATVWAFYAWRIERHDGGSYSDAPLFLGAAITGGFSILCLVAGTAWGMWPYQGEYHQWRTTAGTVESIDSRLLGGSDGSGPTERFVVTFDDGRQRSCDDTRCAQVEEGDELTLACKRAWQWSGTHGYDCNYFSHRAAEGAR